MTYSTYTLASRCHPAAGCSQRARDARDRSDQCVPPILCPERLLIVVLLTELLIHSYFNIVKRELIDMVPKAITLTLVSHSKETLQRELLQELYKPEVLDDLLKESEFVVNRRKEVVSMTQALNKAEEYVHLPCSPTSVANRWIIEFIGSSQVSKHLSFILERCYLLCFFAVFMVYEYYNTPYILCIVDFV